ncbi:8-amino-7-oxononanoate synthase [Silvibacterium bohemicum]|uniref:8-amino-7-oxononanoate synthase n=1 Tax=Silvibacterium bohemicum TaxID=1577686 RepID=A0A841K0V5_9BACT|nr:8-amino-7-oxononanoate synthase [Silvibacterium bohemicum]MBB6147413.1 8-amino-7-oxononanoate synthase [Silvibacterium bohemicum]
MMPQRLARYAATLEQLERKGRRRTLTQPSGIDFTSNDYLGLAGSARLSASVISAIERGVPVGAGGSRLLRGNHPEHEALEAEAAAFFHSERMLYFGSGYAANVAIISTLPQRNDLVVYDELIHASAHEGMAAGRAKAVAVPHNDLDAFADVIRNWRDEGGKGHPWIAVESLYSMDGDRSPLAGLAEVADRYDGFLLIDEAHATGVHGADGRGLAAGLEGRDNVVVLHTCGKALGSSGALVGGSSVLCDYLVNHARPFIYATAPSPLAAASVREALRILADEPQLRHKLQRMIEYANEQLVRHLGIQGSGSQILPVILGDSARTLRVAQQMQADGFDIRAIRPPTVPANTARLRIAITLNVDCPVIANMFERLAQVMAQEHL